MATVKDVLHISQKFWANTKFSIYNEKLFREDTLLRLDSMKAKNILRWKKVLNIEKTLQITMNWYNLYYKKKTNVQNLIERDIEYYLKLTKKIFHE